MKKVHKAVIDRVLSIPSFQHLTEEYLYVCLVKCDQLKPKHFLDFEYILERVEVHMENMED